jgi:hypothetical protein
MLYGKDWKKMQPLIKTRSLVQIRTHAQKVFKKIGLKKIAGVMKRRGGGEKDGDDVGDEELEDVLDDDLEHLGMMEGVDEAMLSSLAQVTAPAPPLSLTHSAPLWSQAHHGMVIPHHLMVPPLPPCLLSSHLSQHSSGGGLMISGHHTAHQVLLSLCPSLSLISLPTGAQL